MGNKFIDNGDGTITDTKTGLMWQKETSPNKMHWDGAIEYCNNLELAGHKNWRLPAVKELFLIVDTGKCNTCIEAAYFPNTMSSNYWSSTTNTSYTDNAWLVDFYFGYVSNDTKSNAYYVRAVRGGQ